MVTQWRHTSYMFNREILLEARLPLHIRLPVGSSSVFIPSVPALVCVTAMSMITQARQPFYNVANSVDYFKLSPIPRTWPTHNVLASWLSSSPHCSIDEYCQWIYILNPCSRVFVSETDTEAQYILILPQEWCHCWPRVHRGREGSWQEASMPFLTESVQGVEASGQGIHKAAVVSLIIQWPMWNMYSCDWDPKPPSKN